MVTRSKCLRVSKKSYGSKMTSLLTHRRKCLLKLENHFHGLQSIPALLNRSYYCHHCEKGYNSETSEDHNCRGQNCSACKRTNKTCPNFATYTTPEVYCSVCNRFFYGQNCFDAHNPYETSSAAAALQNDFKKRYKRAAKGLAAAVAKNGCFALQWKAL